MIAPVTIQTATKAIPAIKRPSASDRVLVLAGAIFRLLMWGNGKTGDRPRNALKMIEGLKRSFGEWILLLAPGHSSRVESWPARMGQRRTRPGYRPETGLDLARAIVIWVVCKEGCR